jgi:glycosyltransferase involved in cell wall biosynthesis
MTHCGLKWVSGVGGSLKNDLPGPKLPNGLINSTETYTLIDNMRIALLGSVTSIIPPIGQAAIERLVYQQAIGLANRGHKILLFAPEGSLVQHKNITIVPVAKNALLTGVGKEGKTTGEELYGASYKLRLEVANIACVMDELVARQDQYDVILNNLRGESVLWSLSSYLKKPLYHIMHLPLFTELSELAKKHAVRLISISDAQRKAYPDLPYVATVYNAVDRNEFSFNATPDNYVLYLGSIGRNKNPKDAMLAAKSAGVPIKIGGRIKDQEYYDTEIKPLIDGAAVSWVGELHPTDVVSLYQKAKAFLFPTLWEEPFGLVLIEAMSCGTPVIAYPNGAIPEIVEDGKNGYIAHSVSEMVDKIKIIDQIDRAVCRKTVEEKFSIEKMIDGYEKVLNASKYE